VRSRDPRAPRLSRAQHLTECHDPLAAARKERGEKIVRRHARLRTRESLTRAQFACFVEACPKHFSTPKTRRLHLVEAHAYPKQSAPIYLSSYESG
jgi:hypothetical protein